MTEKKTTPSVSRRGAIKKLLGTAVVANVAAGTAMAQSRWPYSDWRGDGKFFSFRNGRFRRRVTTVSTAQPTFGASPTQRAAEAFSNTVQAARRLLVDRLPVPSSNGDETKFGDYRAVFSKTLPHNDRGEVDTTAYRTLLRALETGRPEDFDQVQLDQTVRTRRLANPQAAYAFPISGRDGQATRMPPAPGFDTQACAAEMLELYWKALMRDVPFTDYDVSSLYFSALSDINAYPAIAGVPDGARHTAATLFRGETPGDRVGPYISQFLLQDVPFGNGSITQAYPTPAAGADFMATRGEWLTVQRGGVPGQTLKSGQRYIFDGRSLAEYVHVDFTYQAYLNAALILLGWGPDFLDPANPGLSSPTEGTFVTLGAADVLSTVGAVARQALTAAWYQKWLVHRRLRPEVYGGRLEIQRLGEAAYGLPSDLLATDGVSRVQSGQGTSFLSQCYPEGSPTHPAYPAGHACIAGACVTVLKAFFNEDAVVAAPVQANRTGSALNPVSATLTVGGELNKLANNVSLGRDWAGVHYRTDGTAGMTVGEGVALDYLAALSGTYNEQFDGFRLTRFDGRPVTVRGGQIR